MKPADGEQRNRTASTTSAIVPSRPFGCCPARASLRPPADPTNRSTIGVAMKAGAMGVLDERSDIGLQGDVGSDEPALAARRLDLSHDLGTLGLTTSGDDDLRPRTRERNRRASYIDRSFSRRARASHRSGVFKPSVNQPQVSSNSPPASAR